MCALTVEKAKAQAKSITLVVDMMIFLNCRSCRSGQKSLCLRYHLVPDG